MLPLCSSPKKSINNKIETQNSNNCSCSFPKPVSSTLPGPVFQRPFHRSGATPGHNDGQAMADGKEQDKKDPCGHFLLDGDNRKDKSDKAKGAGTGKNPIGQPQRKGSKDSFKIEAI